MKDQIFVILYKKQGKVKALTVDQAAAENDALIADGWELLGAHDACKQIERMHNQIHDLAYCQCDAPLVRTGGTTGEYCGQCGCDIRA